MPHPPPAARIGPGCVSHWRTYRCDAVLAAAVGTGDRVASHAPSSMAISKAPRCKIRCLVMLIYPVALGLLRSSWHQGLSPRAHHQAHRPPRQADQEAPQFAHGSRPCPRPQAAGHTWHHGVGDLRHWPQPAGQYRPAFIDDASKGSNRQQKGAPFKSALDRITFG